MHNIDLIAYSPSPPSAPQRSKRGTTGQRQADDQRHHLGHQRHARRARRHLHLAAKPMTTALLAALVVWFVALLGGLAFIHGAARNNETHDHQTARDAIELKRQQLAKLDTNQTITGHDIALTAPAWMIAVIVHEIEQNMTTTEANR